METEVGSNPKRELIRHLVSDNALPMWLLLPNRERVFETGPIPNWKAFSKTHVINVTRGWEAPMRSEILILINVSKFFFKDMASLH
jgi:hypothetical protein